MTEARTQARAPSRGGEAPLPHFASVEVALAALAPREPVYLLKPAVFRRAVATFLNGFPGTTMYAVKANPAPAVLDQLHAAGIRHFDTASLPEVELVKGRFPDAVCHFMTPLRIKGWAGEAYRRHGVRDFVVDCLEELATVLAETGDAKGLTIFVRLSAPVEGALLELASKFGAEESEAPALLRAVAETGAKPGLTFHVGTQCLKPSAYSQALEICGRVIAASGVALAALDVGGGFAASYLNNTAPTPEAFFATIRAGLQNLALPAKAQVYCEPGRALVAEGISLAAQVILRKDARIYINDGVYGSLDEFRLPGWTAEYPRKVYARDAGGAVRERQGALKPFRVFGPTCDTLDKLPKPLLLPETVASDDWIVFDLVGAYSAALRTRFNGFYPDRFATVD